jgi:RNase H-like domain found in reverse transcriptase/Reverse transcriptase (RNA-dependent DNA polymerase)
MGLKGTGSYFQATMSTIVLVGLLYIFCEVYMDDVLIYAQNDSTFLNNLRQVFERFRKYNITVNPEKCILATTEAEYVGHTISKKGIKFTKEKILKCTSITLPLTVESMQSFLGLANYFRDHIRNHSMLAKPLHDLIPSEKKGRHPILWDDPSRESFYKLLEAIENCPTLHFLHEDAPVFLHTDASDYGIGAYLFQVRDDVQYPVAFVSKTLVQAQLRWSTHEKEAYAIFFSLQRLEYLLRGIHFTLMTDHANLVFINTEGSAKVKRWKLAIQEYDFNILHIPGKDNIIADAFSRLGPKPDLSESGDHNVTPNETKVVAVCMAILSHQTGIDEFVNTSSTPYNAEQRGILSKFHNEVIGHHGVERTYAKLRER